MQYHGTAVRLCSGYLLASSPKMCTVLLAESKSWTIRHLPLVFGKLYPVQLSYIVLSIYGGSGLLPSDLYLIVEQ